MKKEVLHIYIRVSSASQVEKYSLPAQEKEGIGMAKRLGFEYELHVEAGKSASKEDLSNRPVLTELLERCADGVVKHIFATELDRMTRNESVQCDLKSIFVRYNVTFYTTQQTFDFNNPEHQMISSLMASINRFEMDNKSRRSKRSMKEAAKAGKWMGGVMLPYGYKRDEKGFLVIDEEEKLVYLHIIDLCLNGCGTKRIAEELNKQDIPTRGRKALKNGSHKRNKYTNEVTHVKQESFVWKDGTIYKLLTNTLYFGDRVFKDEIITAPAIITKEKWEEVQKTLKNRTKTNQDKNKYFYLLKGLLRCGKCGANFFGRTRADKKDHYYMCSSKRHKGGSCGTRSIGIDKLDDAVWNHLFYNSDLLNILISEQYNNHSNKVNSGVAYDELSKQIERNLDSVKKKKENIVSLFVDGVIDRETFDTRNEIVIEEETQLTKDQKEAELLLESQVEANSYENFITEYQRVFTNFQVDPNSCIEKREAIDKIVDDILINYDEEMKCHHIEMHVKSSISGQKITFQSIDRKGGIINEPLPLTMANELTPTYNSIKSDTVWCGERKGLFVSKPLLEPTKPATE
ncbi:MAG: site-specific DNA recombinase [Crocinitomix sp.]|jgi:site-specific DNA recombinase